MKDTQNSIFLLLGLLLAYIFTRKTDSVSGLRSSVSAGFSGGFSGLPVIGSPVSSSSVYVPVYERSKPLVDTPISVPASGGVPVVSSPVTSSPVTSVPVTSVPVSAVSPVSPISSPALPLSGGSIPVSDVPFSPVASVGGTAIGSFTPSFSF